MLIGNIRRYLQREQFTRQRGQRLYLMREKPSADYFRDLEELTIPTWPTEEGELLDPAIVEQLDVGELSEEEDVVSVVSESDLDEL